MMCSYFLEGESPTFIITIRKASPNITINYKEYTLPNTTQAYRKYKVNTSNGDELDLRCRVHVHRL